MVNYGPKDVTDVVVLLDELFARGPESPCRSAADTNEDDELDVSDAVTLLFYLFLGRRPLDPPFEHCGWDPTPSPLGCLTFPACAPRVTAAGKLFSTGCRPISMAHPAPTCLPAVAYWAWKPLPGAPPG